MSANENMSANEDMNANEDMSASEDNESVGSTSTTASELLEKLLQTHNIKGVNKEGLNEEEQDTLEKLKTNMEKIIEGNKDDLASVKNELQKVIGYKNDENIQVTDEEFNKFLEDIGIPSLGTVKREEEEIAPGTVEAVTATVNAKNIKDGLKDMNYEEVFVNIENNTINVKAKPPPALGGKSKKKQMKPKKSKNKSNKKMKKKQTKKGGKQIKKRSLKRKMKK